MHLSSEAAKAKHSDCQLLRRRFGPVSIVREMSQFQEMDFSALSLDEVKLWIYDNPENIN